MESLAFWQTLLAGGLGGATTVAGQMILGWQSRRGQTEALHRERDLAKADRRDQFELEGLAEVRELMGQLVDIAQTLREAIDEHEERFGDASELWWDSANGRRYFEASARLSRAATSVLDDEVRAQIPKFIDQTRRFINGAEWSGFLRDADLALETVGRRVRVLYGPEVSSRYQEGR